MRGRAPGAVTWTARLLGSLLTLVLVAGCTAGQGSHEAPAASNYRDSGTMSGMSSHHDDSTGSMGSMGSMGSGLGAKGAGSSSCQADTPTPDELAYVAGMAQHHAQALVMVRVITHRRGVPYRVTNYAESLAATQANEIKDMRAWLAAWRKDIARTHCSAVLPPMKSGSKGSMRMGSGSTTSHGPHHLMTGMLTPAQMRFLKAQTGMRAARAFVTLMIQHHHGAIDMSGPMAGLDHNAWVRSLALHVTYSQASEIRAMKRMSKAL